MEEHRPLDRISHERLVLVLAGWDEIESLTALGISLGVIISMNVPFSIQSAEIFQVAKGSLSGVDGVRSKTMPIGQYPVSRHADIKRNFSAPACKAGETGTVESG